MGPKGLIGRRHETLLLAFAWIAASRFAAAGTDGWTPIGPFVAPGGVVTALAVDPNAPSTIYAGTQTGTTGAFSIFRSTNGGTSWSTVKPLYGSFNVAGGPVGVTAFAISREASSIVYVATVGSGILKSTDGGTSWSPSDNGVSSPLVTSLVLDPHLPTTLYASARPACLPVPGIFGACTQVVGGIYKSTDAAASWVLLGAAPPANGITVLAIDPVSPSTLYAAPQGFSGISKTTDGGTTWTTLSGFPSLVVKSFVIDPQRPATLYVGAKSGLDAGGIYKSNDAGLTWAPMMSGLPPLITNVEALVMDPSVPATLYAGTNNGFAQSIDGGQHWTVNQVGPAGALSFAIDPFNPATVFAGTAGGGVQKSIDAGRTWTPTNSAFSPVTVDALAVGVQPSIVYLGSMRYGIFKSTDQGKSWQRTALAPESVHRLVTDPTTSMSVYACTSIGLYKTTDGGEHWQSVNTGIPSIDITSLAIDPVTPSTVYAGVARLGIYKSTDGGTTWAYMSNGLPSQVLFSSDVGAIVIDPFSPSTVYAGFIGQTPFDGMTRGVYKTIDGGINWTAFNTGLTQPQIVDLVIDPLDHRRLYAATYGFSPYAIFTTSDGAEHWSAVTASSNQGTGPIAVDPGPPLTLFMAYGLSSTTDGVSLTSLNPVQTVRNPMCFALDITSSTIYVGTQGGAFQLHLLTAREPVSPTVPRHRTPHIVVPRQ
jgi:photosystem II stability/assembly factor-like uncharacterized protein